jgi:nitrogen-specific signal transduction histidine kinase/GAF domain-containing protein
MLKEQTRYSRLANITKLMNTKLELREVLEFVTLAISEEIVQCDLVGIFLPHEDGTFRGYVGKPNIINGSTLERQIIDPKIDLLASEVIETKKTIYIPDTSKDHRPDPRSVETLQIKSLLALPITFEQELFGLVFLHDYGVPMNLTESEIQSVEAYVNMAAVAIRNANNLTLKENLIAEKQLLLDVTRDLSMCSSMAEGLDKCFFYITKVLNNTNVGVHLIDPLAGRRMKPVKLNKDSDWTEENWIETHKKIVIDQCNDLLIEEVVKTKKALLIPDVSVDERPNLDVCQNFGIKGLLLLPLVSIGEVLGVIAVVNLEENLIYSESQLRLAQSIVDATSSILSNLLHMDKLEYMVDERTKELATANEKVANVVDSITDGFVIINKEWRCLYINEHQFLPLNKTPNDVIGKNIWGLFPKAVDTILYKEFHKAMSQRVPVHFETQLPYSESWYEVTAYPFDEGICSFIKDITEKKKYEMELKRLSGLDLIGQMAAGISHEIRNPMTTVRGFLQLLDTEDDFGKYKAYLSLMIEELDRANSIITEFLSMGNTRASDLQMLDLNTLIHDIAPLIKVDALNQNKFIQFETNHIPELLLNRNEMRQLILNLYRNGLEAMNQGKILTISTYKEDNYVVLAVKDQGKGIKPKVLEKLGTPFFSTKDNGTGLGLGVCYAIAARHNAKIDIQTGPEGTIFSVKFLLPDLE